MTSTEQFKQVIEKLKALSDEELKRRYEEVKSSPFTKQLIAIIDENSKEIIMDIKTREEMLQDLHNHGYTEFAHLSDSELSEKYEQAFGCTIEVG